MTAPNDIPPQARRIFFIGALQAVDRQLDHLQGEKDRITRELEQAKAELQDQAAQREGSRQNEEG